MFNLDYNYIGIDSYLSNECDKNTISIPNLDSYESVYSKNSFLNKKTKPKTFMEEKNQSFKKEKLLDDLTEKSKNKNKNNISLNKEKKCNKKLKIYRGLMFYKEISFEIIQNKSNVCCCEKNIQTDRKYEDSEED